MISINVVYPLLNYSITIIKRVVCRLQMLLLVFGIDFISRVLEQLLTYLINVLKYW